MWEATFQELIRNRNCFCELLSRGRDHGYNRYGHIIVAYFDANNDTIYDNVNRDQLTKNPTRTVSLNGCPWSIRVGIALVLGIGDVTAVISS